MAEAAGTGIELEPGDLATLFGEDQARYLLACPPEHAKVLLARAEEAGVPASMVGRLGGEVMRMGTEHAAMLELVTLWRTAFEAAVV